MEHNGQITPPKTQMKQRSQMSERIEMIDLHSHILPGLDDGAGSIEESMEMARMASQQGIRVMVATPHCAEDLTRDVRSGVKLLREVFAEAKIPVQLYTGMEIFGTFDTARLLRQGRLLTLNGSKYPLIEFAFHTDGAEETEILEDVIAAGYTPLVAHPERYRYICTDPELVNRWTEMGCLFQINRGSLLGRFGLDAQQMGMELVYRGFATVVATDAHSPEIRTPRLRDVYRLLSREISPVVAETLLCRNPHLILKNEQLPPAEPDWF